MICLVIYDLPHLMICLVSYDLASMNDSSFAIGILHIQIQGKCPKIMIQNSGH